MTAKGPSDAAGVGTVAVAVAVADDELGRWGGEATLWRLDQIVGAIFLEADKSNAVRGRIQQRISASTTLHRDFSSPAFLCPCMAISMSYSLPPPKRRRTATSVLSGDFDPRPPRDVLTSLLNGVSMYKEVEQLEEVRRSRKRKDKEREKEDLEREKKRAKTTPKPPKLPPLPAASTSLPVAPSAGVPKRPTAITAPVASSFWRARPAIHIASATRSVSVTPPPMDSSPPPTPGPSISSTTSATSSKRPHTPDDGEDIRSRHRSETATPPPNRPRKKRTAVRKGWKGWVEGSPPPSEKLINLDVVNVLQERKTRSGKNFDAIGVGKDGWV
ncbi:uncharacterized protein FIBRA_01216 [Fibroporia radiculosa]|uniref:Uncharacterized protein n=1 Tax=Fibroporia radiculosa TaxID=599839 RepID=J4I8D1_9APHY|nr:uncharacterized protein FIBRA_01216 [Fibroporia radiculosa]CCL99201.1 predicted protein [Fibroporia radiculosa]